LLVTKGSEEFVASIFFSKDGDSSHS